MSDIMIAFFSKLYVLMENITVPLYYRDCYKFLLIPNLFRIHIKTALHVFSIRKSKQINQDNTKHPTDIIRLRKAAILN